ncbi:MAG: O-antigen ligase family protein [Phycisphaeraceae bacterium]|nr:O-antigen ligase family protein [Phycisphaeraceae bacterium]
MQDPRSVRAWEHTLAGRWLPGVHLVMGAACCVAVSFPISVLEFAIAITAVATVVRIAGTWRLVVAALAHPIVICTLLWGLWLVAGVAWSADPRAGWSDAGRMRLALVLVALWPLAHRRGVLIAAYLCGFAVGHVMQLVQVFGGRTFLEGLISTTMSPDRISGWWGPVSGGSMLCVPLGMHIWAAVHGRGRWRAVAITGVAVTFAAILATGTRGAWVSAAVLLVIGGVCACRRGRRRVLVIGAGALAAALAVAWLVFGDVLASRVRDARNELAAAQAGEVETNIGARLVMWETAIAAFRAHPIKGVGTGGYAAWGREVLARTSPELDPRLVMDHAHGMYVHTAATGGVVGLVILGSLLFVVAWWGGRDDPAAGERLQASGYSSSIRLGLVGLLIAAMFETVTVGMRVGVHLWMMAALAPVWGGAIVRARDARPRG